MVYVDDVDGFLYETLYGCTLYYQALGFGFGIFFCWFWLLGLFGSLLFSLAFSALSIISYPMPSCFIIDAAARLFMRFVSSLSQSERPTTLHKMQTSKA